MFAAERHREILAALRDEGRIAVQDVAQRMSVTPETVRRDLSELEHRGLLRRTHGGAVRVERLSYSTPVTARKGLYDAEKSAIAAEALKLIEDDSTIGIDAGTTTIRLAQLIPSDRRLTVVTYSVIVAGILAGNSRMKVYMVGGEVLENSRAAIGPWALDAVSRVTLDAVFLSVDGVNRRHGLTTHNAAEAAVKEALIGASRRSIVLADHSKLKREEFARIAGLDAVDRIITDEGAEAEYVAELAECGPEITLAHLGSSG